MHTQQRNKTLICNQKDGDRKKGRKGKKTKKDIRTNLHTQ